MLGSFKHLLHFILKGGDEHFKFCPCLTMDKTLRRNCGNVFEEYYFSHLMIWTFSHDWNYCVPNFLFCWEILNLCNVGMSKLRNSKWWDSFLNILNSKNWKFEMLIYFKPEKSKTMTGEWLNLVQTIIQTRWYEFHIDQKHETDIW